VARTEAHGEGAGGWGMGAEQGELLPGKTAAQTQTDWGCHPQSQATPEKIKIFSFSISNLRAKD